MSRSRNHSCGRTCGICVYTPARNRRDEAAQTVDGRERQAEHDDYDWECPPTCDGRNCSFCDPMCFEWSRYQKDEPLTVTLAEVLRCLGN